VQELTELIEVEVQSHACTSHRENAESQTWLLYRDRPTSGMVWRDMSELT